MDEFTHVRIATPSDAELLGRLFDQYRQFHGEPADIGRSMEFMKARLTQMDSTILVATWWTEGEAYLQMHPALSSLKTEKIFLISDFYAPRNFLWKDLVDALLLEASNLAAKADVYRLEMRHSGVDPWLQEFFEEAGFRWEAPHCSFSLDLPGRTPISNSPRVEVEPEKLPREKKVSSVIHQFFRLHSGLLEGWAVRRRMHRIEYVHGTESWWFRWRHPVCGRVDMNLLPISLQSAIGWSSWFYPVPDQKRLFWKELQLGAIDFRQPDALGQLDAWVRIIASSACEGGEPWGTEDLPPDKLETSEYDKQLHIPYGLGLEPG